MGLREDIAADLRAKIHAMELAPGDPVPSSESLRRTWLCSDAPVRQALLLLKNEGLIATRRGGAPRVNPPGMWGPRPEPEPGRPPPRPGPGADRIAVSVPLAADCTLTLRLTRRLSLAEFGDLLVLVTAMGPVLREPAPPPAPDLLP